MAMWTQISEVCASYPAMLFCSAGESIESRINGVFPEDWRKNGILICAGNSWRIKSICHVCYSVSFPAPLYAVSAISKKENHCEGKCLLSACVLSFSFSFFPLRISNETEESNLRTDFRIWRTHSGTQSTQLEFTFLPDMKWFFVFYESKKICPAKTERRACPNEDLDYIYHDTEGSNGKLAKRVHLSRNWITSRVVFISLSLKTYTRVESPIWVWGGGTPELKNTRGTLMSLYSNWRPSLRFLVTIHYLAVSKLNWGISAFTYFHLWFCSLIKLNGACCCMRHVRDLCICLIYSPTTDK